MAYKAIDIAKYVVTRCTMDMHPISNLQLQKILYFIQINFIRNFNELAFDDDMEAWQHGPVVSSVYREFMSEGANRILRVYPETLNMFRDNHREVIDGVTYACRDMDPWVLVARTHKLGTPWEKYYNRDKRNIIPIKAIIEYAVEN